MKKDKRNFLIRILPETKQIILTATNDLDFVWLEEQINEIERS